MANEFLETLLRLNVAAAIAVTVVLFLRRGVRRLAGARAAYALWLVVPAAMLTGLLPPRSLTIVLSGVTQSAPAGREVAPFTPTAPLAAAIDWWTIALVVWAVGALAGLAWLAWRHARFLRHVGRRAEDGKLNALIDGVGPAVVGVIAPKILLPADFEDRFTPKERDVVLAHEQFHLSQKHAQTNALVLLGLCLNWFNPMLHLGSRTLRIDQELACDEAVIARFPKARRSYAEAMLKTQFTAEPLSLGCYWPATGSVLRQRLALLHAPSPARWRTVVGGGLAVTLAVVAGVGAWASQPATVVYRLTDQEGSDQSVDAIPSPPMPGAPEIAAQLEASRQSVVDEIVTARQAYETAQKQGAPVQAETLATVQSAERALALFDQAVEDFGRGSDQSQDFDRPREPMFIEAASASARATASGPSVYARQPPRDPAQIDKGAKVWIETAAILPDGRLIGGQAMFNRPGSTKAQGGYYQGDPRYSLASSVSQEGDRVQVRPKLIFNGKLVGEGSAWVESGRVATIHLNNGQVVTARAEVGGVKIGLALNQRP